MKHTKGQRKNDMKTRMKTFILTAMLMILFSAGSLSAHDLNKAEAASTTKMTKTAFQTTANLNLRTKAGTKYPLLLTIPKSKVVYATEKYGTWYKVMYTFDSKGKKITKSGWVNKTYLKEYYQYMKINGSYYFTNKSTGLYPTPDTKKKPYYNLTNNNGLYSTQKIINAIGQTWYRVSFSGKTVYINSNSVKKVTPTTFSSTNFKAKNKTTLYEKYGKAYKSIASIQKDQMISSSYSIGDWYKVTIEKKTGYIFKGDFEELTQEEVPNQPEIPYTEEAISGKTLLLLEQLNLRKMASDTSESFAIIPKGKLVVPTHQTSNGWYKVSFEGKIGYLLGNHLQEVKTGDPISHRDGYQFIDLRTKSKVTATQIDNYIQSYVKLTGKPSVLSKKGQLFIQTGEKYGVNALYLAAHAIHESAYGTSNISLGKFNLFGFGAYDATEFISAYRFKTVDENIEYIAQEMKATYLNEKNWKYHGAYLGYSTKTMTNTRIDANSEGMNFYYASDPSWGAKIAAHMQNILPYNKADYKGATPDTRTFSSPPIPALSEVFPKNIQAIAKTDLELRNKKGDSTTTAKLKKGAEFSLLEKTNDYWIRVQYQGKEYWISGIKFDRYSSYLSVKNLGRVNVSGLNVRPDASTVNSPIGIFNLNEYVQLVLDKDGNIVMNSSKTWYQVKLSSGKNGWVNASYIDRELK